MHRGFVGLEAEEFSIARHCAIQIASLLQFGGAAQQFFRRRHLCEKRRGQQESGRQEAIHRVLIVYKKIMGWPKPSHS